MDKTPAKGLVAIGFSTPDRPRLLAEQAAEAGISMCWSVEWLARHRAGGPGV